MMRNRQNFSSKILSQTKSCLSSGMRNPSISDVTLDLHFLLPRDWERGDVAEESDLSGRLHPWRFLWWLPHPPSSFLLDHGGLPCGGEWQHPHHSPHLCRSPASYTHVPPTQPALPHGSDACLHNHPQGGYQLPIWQEVHLLCGLCDAALPLFVSGWCRVSSASSHVLWPLCCHLPSTALHRSHEQRGGTDDGSHVMVGSIHKLPNSHGNFDAFPFLWASKNPPLLLLSFQLLWSWYVETSPFMRTQCTSAASCFSSSQSSWFPHPMSSSSAVSFSCAQLAVREMPLPLVALTSLWFPCGLVPASSHIWGPGPSTLHCKTKLVLCSIASLLPHWILWFILSGIRT